MAAKPEPAGDTDSFSGLLVDHCLAVLDLIEQLLDECLFEGLTAEDEPNNLLMSVTLLPHII